jgi:RHS repeat-associated protein
MTSDFGFTGDYYHAATGLSLTLYRAYDPNLGRWLSRDPLGEAGGLNLYGYVGNDPINLLDPFGLKYAEMYAGYGAVGGGAAAAVGSIAVDAATGGVNVLATPAEVAGGAALGGILGYDVGKLVDIITGNSETPAIPITVNAMQAKPKNCPTGTVPIDSSEGRKRLPTGVKPHDAKGQVGAGPTDWTGIDPDGNIITSGENNEAEDNGPYVGNPSK